MIRKITLSFLSLLVLHVSLKAQQCGSSDVLIQKIRAIDPVTYDQKMEEMTQKWVDWVNEHSSSLSKLAKTTPTGVGKQVIYTIPVVVHIMHTGGAIGTAYNPTDAQIDSLIAYVNKVYATQYSSFPDSAHGGTPLPIRYVLAQRDTACNSTTGITRTNASSVPGYSTNGINFASTSGVPDTTIKNLNRWPVDQYMNVWIVNKIDSGDGYSATSSYVAGFAYIPPYDPPKYDGVIMLAQQVTAGTVTLPHELGHTNGLYHVFQGGSATACPPTGSCDTTGDFVCDTQPEKNSNFTCPSDPNPCTGSSYDNTQHNIMDYSNCQNRFTPGQRSRMLFTLLNYRQNLIGSLGGIAPGTAPATACKPGILNPANTYNAGPTEVKISGPTAADTTFGALNTYLDYTSGGYNTDGDAAYLDLTCKQGTTLIAGNSYLFSVRTGYYPFGENVRIFMDYNNDGKFDTSELVYQHIGSVYHELDTATLTIPTTTTRSGLATCTPIRMRVISDYNTRDSACSDLKYGQAEDYAITIMGSGLTAGGVSISIPYGYDTTCDGTSITFTAKPTDTSVKGVLYKWYVNNVYNGIVSSTFTSSSLSDGSTVYCKIYYSGACGSDSAISNTITIHHAASLKPRANISLISGNNPGCPGQTLIFAANVVTGGTSPTYQWVVNGSNVGFSIPAYSQVFNNGDKIYCILTSNATCASPLTVNSDTVTIVRQKETDSVYINNTTPFPACSGKPVTFKAYTSYPSSPSYQWLVNGVPVTGATGSTFTDDSLNNGDLITCAIAAWDSCITNHLDTSLAVVARILPSATPEVSLAVTNGNNPGCIDSSITITATEKNFGVNPSFSWYINGTLVASGTTTYSSSSFNNGDVITFTGIPTDGACYTSDTVASAPLTIHVYPKPAAPVISLIGNMLVANQPGPFAWFGPGGIVAGQSGQSMHPPVEGSYYAETNDSGCFSDPSNVLNVSLLVVNSYNMDNVKIYPNPSKGQLILDWGNKTVNMKIAIYNVLGQGVLQDEVNNQTTKTLDLSYLPDGNYFVVLRDTDGKIGTVNISLSK